MRAMVYRRYGGIEQLHLEERPTPESRAGELRLRVHATAVNSWDWDKLRGVPFPNRIPGLFRPAHLVLGADVAGVVDAVGPGVTRFKPGDRVLGDLCASGWGGFAAFACAKETALASLPESVAFEDAAALPQAGCMALQALREIGRMRGGQHVLFNGAGGGVGTYGIQLAKQAGLEVTAVDRGDKADLLRKVGADHVLDYTRDDYAAAGPRYDLIVDVVGRRPPVDVLRALKPGGRYAMVGGPLARIVQTLLVGGWLGRREGKTPPS